MTKKNKQELNDLLVKANELRHRDSKAKNVLIQEIINFLDKIKKNNTHKARLEKITFESVTHSNDFHVNLQHDDAWKKGKRDLILFLNTLDEQKKEYA